MGRGVKQVCHKGHRVQRLRVLVCQGAVVFRTQESWFTAQSIVCLDM